MALASEVQYSEGSASLPAVSSSSQPPEAGGSCTVPTSLSSNSSFSTASRWHNDCQHKSSVEEEGGRKGSSGYPAPAAAQSILWSVHSMPRSCSSEFCSEGQPLAAVDGEALLACFWGTQWHLVVWWVAFLWQPSDSSRNQEYYLNVWICFSLRSRRKREL